MSLNFLLIGHREESLWFHNLVNALETLGKLQIFPETEAMQDILQHEYHMVIIDAGSVRKEMILVLQVRARQPHTRILAVTSTPTWQQTREALQAGAMDYLSKSMSEREYLSTFKDILAKSAPAWPQ